MGNSFFEDFSAALTLLDKFILCWEKTAEVHKWPVSDVIAVQYALDGKSDCFTRSEGVRSCAEQLDPDQLFAELSSKILEVSAYYAKGGASFTSNNYINFILRHFSKNQDYDPDKISEIIDFLKNILSYSAKRDSQNSGYRASLYKLFKEPHSFTVMQNSDTTIGEIISDTIIKYKDDIVNMNLTDSPDFGSR